MQVGDRVVGYALARLVVLYVRLRRRVGNWARALAWWGARRRAIRAELEAADA